MAADRAYSLRLEGSETFRALPYFDCRFVLALPLACYLSSKCERHQQTHV